MTPCTPNPDKGVVLDTQPGIEIHEDVLYGPITDHGWHNDPLWGIYDRSGRLIDAAAYYRGPGKNTVGQSAHIDRTTLQADDAPDETYLYGGVIIQHFGHFLLTSISRYWPFLNHSLSDTLRPYKILHHCVFGEEHWWKLPYASAPLEAIGLSQDRFVHFSRPTRIRRLIVPRPCFEEHNFVHTVYLDLARTIGTHLLGTGTPTQEGAAYVSRAHYHPITQGFENEQGLVNVLEAFGVEIFYPETMTFADQVRLFARRQVVAGMVGSAFHAAIFAPNPANLLFLSPAALVNANFDLLDRVGRLRTEYYFADSRLLEVGAKGRIYSRFELNDPLLLAKQLLILLQKSCT